jgi:CheY-like chemotaxis protein
MSLRQVDAGLDSSQYKGRSTGLGLAISRRLAHALCGSIGVRSVPGIGSQFFVRLPVAVCPNFEGVASCQAPSHPQAPLHPPGAGAAAPRSSEQRTALSIDASVGPMVTFEEDSGALPKTLSWQQALSRSAYRALDKTPRHAELKAPTPRSAQSSVSGTDAEPDASGTGTARDAGLSRNADPVIASASSVPRQRLRILLVDDSAVNRHMLIRALRQAQPLASYALDIVEAADGIDAMRLLGVASASDDRAGAAGAAGSTANADPQLSGQHSHSYDVCLCDAEMPVMNGYEMVAALKRAGVVLPVIGVTGNALPADVQRFLDAGASAVVTKPVRVAQLLQALLAAVVTPYGAL